MLVYVDSENRIRDVGTTSNPDLTEIYINDEENPFKDWPIGKICCYKITVQDGMVTMFTPYVPTDIWDIFIPIRESVANIDTRTEKNTSDIDYIAMETGVDLDVTLGSEDTENTEENPSDEVVEEVDHE